jgi:predicted nucleic acid-binding protein
MSTLNWRGERWSAKRFLELLNVAGRQWRWREGQAPGSLDRVATWVSRGLTAYDASYVALAEQLDFPLVTEDRAILEVARDVAITLRDGPPGR